MHLPTGFLLLLAVPAAGQDGPDDIARRKAAHTPRMSYLDNGTIKLGVDLNLGGAITYLSLSGSEDNVVNNWDWGRQIQMSHYGGPTPFRVPGKEPAKEWAGFGWNPVQAGDHFGHPSRVLDSSNDGKELRVRCVPMQWSMPDVPCECVYETRITLDGPTARVRCQLVNRRSDRTLYPAHDQELPAVYVNGPYYRLMSYTGDAPFTGGELTRVEKKSVKGDTFPWARFLATERWAAQVNDAGWGLGVYQPKCVAFLGGFAGRPGHGGTKDGPTGYIAPVRPELLDHNIEYTHEYVLILGKLDEIRRRVYALQGKPRPPAYAFRNDRQGWTLTGATDQGWPFKGSWDITTAKPGAQLMGPTDFWFSTDAPMLTVEAAFKADVDRVRVYWATLAEPAFANSRSRDLAILGDDTMRTYRLRLADADSYQGGIVRLRVDPGAGQLRVRSISLGR